jgi:hypothetical protein
VKCSLRRQTSPLPNYERLRMSLFMLEARLTTGRFGKEIRMELLAAIPEWLVWCAAAAAGTTALAALASILDAALELDAT